ncbi:MAG: hypothetical protein WCF65_04235 [Parachlamydiaceae bacterium]
MGQNPDNLRVGGIPEGINPGELEIQRLLNSIEDPPISPVTFTPLAAKYKFALFSNIKDSLKKIFPRYFKATLKSEILLSNRRITLSGGKSPLDLNNLSTIADSKPEELLDYFIPLIKVGEDIFDNRAITGLGAVASTFQLTGIACIIVQVHIVKILEEITKRRREKLETGKRLGSVDPAELAQLEEDIKKNEKWIESTKKQVAERSKIEGLTAALITPELVNQVLTAFCSVSGVALKAMGSLCLGTTVLSSWVQLKEAQKKQSEYEEFEKIISNLAPTLVGKPGVDKIISQQLDVKKEKYNKNLNIKKQLIGELIEQFRSDGNLINFREGLKKGNFDASNGIDLDKDALIKKLNDPELLEKMAINATQKEEASSVMLRTALATYAAQKVKIDNSFLSFRLIKAKLKLSSSGTFAAIGIIAKMLAISITAGVLTSLSATGFGLLGTAIGATVVGAIYFYVKKPNLFKLYLRGIPAKVLLKKIPIFIQSCRTLIITRKLEKLGLEILQTDNRQNLGKMRKLNQKKIELENSIRKRTDEVAVMESLMMEAGWKDYKKSLGQEGVKSQASDEIFVEFLSQSHDENDETDNIWSVMGVDLKALREGQGDDEVRNQAARCIRSFFGADEGKTLKQLKKHQEIQKHEIDIEV